MAGSNMPAPEVDVTDDLVRALLADQHPDLAELTIDELANGWDNVIYRVGDELTVRLPRREMAAVLVDHEQAVLPRLAAQLPIAIPAPVRIGRPALGYPWSWSVNPWLPGTIAATTPFSDPAAEAQRLGAFLRALHVPAPDDAPPNPYRGHFIGDNTAVFTERVDVLRGTSGFDADPALVRWAELVDVDDATWQRAEAWALHFAVTYLVHSADNPTMGSIGNRLLDALGLASER